MKIESARADVFKQARGFLDDHLAGRCGGVFLDDDGVGAFGHDAAGEDAHRLALADAAVKGTPGGRVADEQTAWRRLRHRAARTA